ncbi:MAG: phenylalanine--tRNA ligase subunit beta [Flavobacteriales bacterium]|nr:phenylalanine--tRNA ligase subunit beta [Flavobacteriales bacterium]
MDISYNWLRQYLPINLDVNEAAALLTGSGLEVEKVIPFSSVEGGLEGLVIGEVLSKEKHPDADRLNCTKVNIGTGEPLDIVCGAPNVAAGQKVVVAVVGAKLYPSEGEPFEIKKSKIRGQVSEGMICAEDEIGLGQGHDGIMVLPADVKVGTPASEYFKIENDFVLEIGLTPNRADAMSHIGVARDLRAVIREIKGGHENLKLEWPDVMGYSAELKENPIAIDVQDLEACPRYVGLYIQGIEVKPSPAWLQNRLKAIGARPINNVVDVTNFVLHELGQPLHAFDADKIKDHKVVVRTAKTGEKFTTLDEVERDLNQDDLMICNASDGMCIAGVFGGLNSGVTEKTKNVFLESAYFNPVSIRKTAKRHGLSTDASFRFERGIDPETVVYAAKRAALLIQEVAGGKLSVITDIYPNPIPHQKVEVKFANINRLIGQDIPKETVLSILDDLGIYVEKKREDGLKLSVPSFKNDVTREADVIEEVLRVYGYDRILGSGQLRVPLIASNKKSPEQLRNLVSDALTAQGFNEIMNNSLTKASYMDKLFPEQANAKVEILNPLSTDLNAMRQSLLFGGLESVSRNIRHQNLNCKFYEFGNLYETSPNPSKEGKQAPPLTPPRREGEFAVTRSDDSGNVKSERTSPPLEGAGADGVVWPYSEHRSLALFITGRWQKERWNAAAGNATFHHIHGAVKSILNRLGIEAQLHDVTGTKAYAYGMEFRTKDGKLLANFGLVNADVLEAFDIDQEVFYADFDWDLVLKRSALNSIEVTELAKYPSVRRDLALFVDKTVKYAQLEQLAFQTERNILKEVDLFDVYEGKGVPEGKRSYAMSFILQDEKATLNDKTIEKTMNRLQQRFEQEVGAVLRG